MIVRDATPEDAEEVVAIYNHYVLNSHATFDVAPIDEHEMRQRISQDMYPFVVAVSDSIVGYAYCHAYRPRAAYRSTAEISVYVRPGQEGRGIGRSLYKGLFSRLRAAGFHALVAGIALPNDASIRLHESFGMEKVAHFREVGQKFDRWVDVGYWEVLLDPADG